MFIKLHVQLKLRMHNYANVFMIAAFKLPMNLEKYLEIVIFSTPGTSLNNHIYALHAISLSLTV